MAGSVARHTVRHRDVRNAEAAELIQKCTHACCAVPFVPALAHCRAQEHRPFTHCGTNAGLPHCRGQESHTGPTPCALQAKHTTEHAKVKVDDVGSAADTAGHTATVKGSRTLQRAGEKVGRRILRHTYTLGERLGKGKVG